MYSCLYFCIRDRIAQESGKNDPKMATLLVVISSKCDNVIGDTGRFLWLC
jgi:hypothetical protein